jgi:hypothetical protein
MMVNPDGARREIGPDDRHTINPYTLGQLDAQRWAPRLPLYDSPANAQRYAAGWLEHDLHRPVPNVLHPRWRWLPLIRVVAAPAQAAVRGKTRVPLPVT